MPQSSPTSDAPLYDRDALQSLLSACHNRMLDDPHGPQAEPEDGSLEAANSFVTAVPALGVIRVHGEDANTFLQGQLTNDLDKMSAGQAQWSGLCSPKGRLLASFLVARSETDILLVISRELAAGIAKRLAMYVLRAKVKVEDVSAAHLVLGVQGSGAGAGLSAASLASPEPMTLAGDTTMVIGIPPITAAGQLNPRHLVIAAAADVSRLWDSLSAELPARPSSWWRAGEVISGIARITPPIQEAFVPQMINFELIGGVDFEKGCYTGQEVVARSQHLGKMKRRMFLATSKKAPAPGAEVTDADGKSNGTVVASGPSLAVGADDDAVLLYESRVDTDGDLMVDGERLNRLPLPYEIPEPKPFVRPV